MKAVIREINTEYSKDQLLRLNATYGAKALADLFAVEDFADLVTVTLDYKGSVGEPVVFIEMLKVVPRYAPANIQPESLVLDMKEWFGTDRVDHNLLRQIVSEYRTLIEEILAVGPPPQVVARSI